MNDTTAEIMVMTEDMVEHYRKQLCLDEYSQATIEKYIRDIRAFFRFLPDSKMVSKESVIAYKKELEQHYAASSANSMLVSVNRFLKCTGGERCCVKLFRIQRNIYCNKEKELTREEYFKLVEAAEKQGNERLSMIMQTICSTGIRVSELKYIDVLSVKKEQVRVSCKGKVRTIFLPKQLCRALSVYCKTHEIKKGSIFVTRSGSPVNRSNVWRAMKQLSASCGIAFQKIFPHNLRHLFARTFYDMKKDIVRLADLLGHASMETTRIYTISSGSDQKRILSQMNLCCAGKIKTT